MADDIPVDQDGSQSMYSQIDKRLSSIFGPINRELEGVMGKPDPVQTFMMALSALRPGAMSPRGGSMPFFMQQPRGPGTPQVPPGGQTPIIGGVRPGITERGAPSTGVWPTDQFPPVIPETPVASNIPLATGQPQVNSIPRGPQMDPRFGGSTPLGTKQQPVIPPNSNDMVLRMLQEGTGPFGALGPTTRMSGAGVGGRFRPQTFDPSTEMASRFSDMFSGRRVLTPANRTSDQSFNLSVIRQLLGE